MLGQEQDDGTVQFFHAYPWSRSGLFPSTCPSDCYLEAHAAASLKVHLLAQSLTPCRGEQRAQE